MRLEGRRHCGAATVSNGRTGQSDWQQWPADAGQARSRCRLRCLVCVLAVFAVSQTDAATEVRSVNIRGLQIAGTTTIRIDGTDLLPHPQLASSLPIARQVLKPGATANRVEFEVTLDADVEPGLYNLWLISGHGVSLPTVVAVDRLPQLPFSAELQALPAALHGSAAGSNRLRTTIEVKKDQPVLVEVEARRLGGKLRPVLHIYDSENRQLDWALPSPTLRGDARVKFTAPADGAYTIELHDLEYAAPAPNFFRLKIGTWQYADQVFPPAVQAGTPTQLTLIGDPADTETVSFSGSPDAAASVTWAPWKNAAKSGGFRPPVLISRFPEIVEGTAEQSPQKLPAIPSAVSGRLLLPDEQDRFQVDVTPGTKLRFEVFAERTGSPVDATLEIQNGQGGRLGINDDAAGSPDSRIDYTVPANLKSLWIVIRDTNGRSGPDCLYRIAVTPLPGSGSADFQLKLQEQRQSVATGKRLVMKVIAERTAYQGPIDLQFDTLPAGIQVQGARIAAGSSATLVTLHGAGAGLDHSLSRFRGVATINGTRVQRLATVERPLPEANQPWLNREFALAVSKPASTGFQMDWGETAPDTRLVLGGKLDLPVSAVRPPGFDGPVRLVLKTSQVAVRAANRQIDTNRTLRSETNRPLEIAADANAQKTWDAKLAADQAVSAAVKSQTAVAATGRQKVTVAQAAVTAAMKQLAASKELAAKTTTATKLAADADAVARKALTAAVTKVKETARSANQADPAKLAEAARAAAGAAAVAKVAAEQKAASGKVLTAATLDAKQATDALTAAENTVTAATAGHKAAIGAAEKADGLEAAKVKAATAKHAAAERAAISASALAKNDGVFSIFVPAQLTEPGYEFALQAELLSRDKKTVIDRSDTSLRRFTTLIPIVVSLASSEPYVASIDPKSGAKITVVGKVQRLAGMNQDVTVTLAGLPGGITVPKAIVKADQTDFQLDISFPAKFQPAELNSVRVFATGKMRPKAPIDVRSEERTLSLRLEAAAAPAGTPD